MTRQRTIEIQNYADLEKFVLDKIKRGASITNLINDIKQSRGCVVGSDLLANIDFSVNKIVSNFKPYPFMLKAMTNFIIAPINGKNNEYFFFDEATKTQQAINKQLLNELFPADCHDLWRKNILIVEKVYEPRTPCGLIDDNTKFNTWNPPPHWSQDGKYDRNTLPPQYEKFFRHISGQTEESYQFLLEWITISLQARNLTYLVLAGISGTGKGTLFSILKALHGHSNAVDSPFSREIKSSFNEILQNRTLICLNEVNKISQADYDYLKTFNSDETRFEGKNQAAKMTKNSWNVMICSNNTDGFPHIPKDDRRMSIIDSPNCRIETIFTPSERDALFKDEEAIKELYKYFMNRTYDVKNVSFAFKGKNSKEVSYASMEDWQKFLLIEVAQKYAGKTLPISRLRLILKEECQINANFTESDLRKLSIDSPGVFRIVKSDRYLDDNNSAPPSRPTRLRCIQFNNIEDQVDYADLIDNDDDDEAE